MAKLTAEQIAFAKRIWSFPGVNWSPDAETCRLMGAMVAARDAALLQPFRELLLDLARHAKDIGHDLETYSDPELREINSGAILGLSQAYVKLRALLDAAEGKSDG